MLLYIFEFSLNNLLYSLKWWYELKKKIHNKCIASHLNFELCLRCSDYFSFFHLMVIICWKIGYSFIPSKKEQWRRYSRKKNRIHPSFCLLALIGKSQFFFYQNKIGCKIVSFQWPRICVYFFNTSVYSSNVQFINKFWI